MSSSSLIILCNIPARSGFIQYFFPGGREPGGEPRRERVAGSHLKLLSRRQKPLFGYRVYDHILHTHPMVWIAFNLQSINGLRDIWVRLLIFQGSLRYFLSGMELRRLWTILATRRFFDLAHGICPYGCSFYNWRVRPHPRPSPGGRGGRAVFTCRSGLSYIGGKCETTLILYGNRVSWGCWRGISHRAMASYGT